MRRATGFFLWQPQPVGSTPEGQGFRTWKSGLLGGQLSAEPSAPKGSGRTLQTALCTSGEGHQGLGDPYSRKAWLLHTLGASVSGRNGHPPTPPEESDIPAQQPEPESAWRPHETQRVRALSSALGSLSVCAHGVRCRAGSSAGCVYVSCLILSPGHQCSCRESLLVGCPVHFVGPLDQMRWRNWDCDSLGHSSHTTIGVLFKESL